MNAEIAFQAKKYRGKLVCWYKTSHPLLVLKPVKVERVHVNPDISLYRKVLSENEVQRIKEIALPMVG